MTDVIDEEVQEDEVKLPESSDEEEKQVVKEEEKTAEELAEEERQAAIRAKDDEIVSLRSMTREQKRSLDALESKLQETNKILEKANLVSEEDKEAAEAARNAQALRMEQLENILDFMELNPRYEDVREVCSQDNFDTMIETMANALVAKQGGDVKEITKAIEAEVWALRNPYKYMYGLIKEHHPSFKKPGDDAKKQNEQVPSIPTTLQDLPAGDRNASGAWTAAKIDALDESELGKVPADIYDKYMKGQLK